MSSGRHHSFRSLRLIAALGSALAVFATLADSEASCPDGSECFQSQAPGETPSQQMPTPACTGRPCRTPLRLTSPAWAPMALGGAVSTLRPVPVRPLLSSEPVAPPTPPPIAPPAVL
jgi:hypothetical protein